MTSLYQSFQKRSSSFMPTTTKQALPVSQSDPKEQLGLQLRRRLSSLSLKIQPSSTAPDNVINSTTSWVFLSRSKSVSSMGENAGGTIKKWWDWGWGWILSRKPTFAKDLEMNEQETASLGCHNKGSWRHVFYKVRSEFRRLVGSDHHNVRLPQTFRYDAMAYSRNFDNGKNTSRTSHQG